MSYVEPPNTNTWEVVQGPLYGPLRGPLYTTAIGLGKHFRIAMDLAYWLADQAIESLTESPYSMGDCSVSQEAILIATRMGFIADPEYIKIVHERCVKRANQ